jgi:hypothetical protein
MQMTNHDENLSFMAAGPNSFPSAEKNQCRAALSGESTKAIKRHKKLE